MNNNKWIVTVEEDTDGNTVLPFPKGMIDQMDWREGDTLNFQINDDESCVIVNLSWEDRERKHHQG